MDQTPGGMPPMESAATSAGSRLIAGIVAAVMAAAVGAVLVYVLTAKARLGQPVPILLVGPLVGLAVRLVRGPGDSRMAIIACLLAFAGATAGFLWAEPEVFKDPKLENSIRRMLSLHGIVVFGATMYFAYVLTRRHGQ